MFSSGSNASLGSLVQPLPCSPRTILPLDPFMRPSSFDQSSALTRPLSVTPTVKEASNFSPSSSPRCIRGRPRTPSPRTPITSRSPCTPSPSSRRSPCTPSPKPNRSPCSPSQRPCRSPCPPSPRPIRSPGPPSPRPCRSPGPLTPRPSRSPGPPSPRSPRLSRSPSPHPIKNQRCSSQPTHMSRPGVAVVVSKWRKRSLTEIKGI